MAWMAYFIILAVDGTKCFPVPGAL